VQETFLTVTAKAEQFERGTNFRAWAWMIARYKALQALEKRAAPHERFAPEVIEALCAHEASEQSPDEERMRWLTLCMEALAPRAREAVRLRYEQAQRPPEVARSMGWRVEAVHVALSRARIFLRDCVTQKMTEARG
jgi:RNA polymerase sigma-70 factor (ECF subfamily)